MSGSMLKSLKEKILTHETIVVNFHAIILALFSIFYKFFCKLVSYVNQFALS